MADSATEYTDYGNFARAWSDTDDDETRMLWQLLGELDRDEVLIHIPPWLAEAKIEFVDGATPTTFVGRIDRQTDEAIRFVESASARPLAKLTHRIPNLEAGIERVGNSDEDRREWLEDRLRQTRIAFENRDDTTALTEEWLPRSQLHNVVRRTD